MAYVQLIEVEGERAFRAGDEGTPHVFRVEDDGALTKAFQAAVAEALVDGHVDDLEGTERDMAVAMAQEVGIGKAVSEGSVCIGWWPFDNDQDGDDQFAGQLAKLASGIPGAVHSEDLHMTLLYLGSTAEGEWDVTLLAAVLKLYTQRCSTIKGCVTGIGRFCGPEDKDVIIALLDIPGVGAHRQCVSQEISYAGRAVPYTAWDASAEHGFVPHITLAYVDKSTPVSLSLDETIPFGIDSWSLAVGPQRVDFEFPTWEDEVCETGPDAMQAYYAAKALSYAPEAEQGAEASQLKAALEDGALAGDDEAGIAYAVTKATDEKRFTLGPLYVPNRTDAHNEGVDPDILQGAVWDYVKASSESGRRIHLQHDAYGDVTVGEWVECMAWPYDHTVTMHKADGESYEVEMPAGTVYLGVVWDEEAWPYVKEGKLGGYSMGGRAVRIASDEQWAPMAGKATDIKPHAYEPSDEDADVCKLCGKGKSDSIHSAKEKE